MKPRRELSFILFAVVFVACLIQALKGGDFMGYIRAVREVLANGLSQPPYPLSQAYNGDYFQSPVTTLWLFLLSYLPDLAIRIFWNGLNITGVFYLISIYCPKRVQTPYTLFLLLLFSHALSDVFLSQNPIFIVLVLLVAADRCFTSEKKLGLGAGLFAIAIFLRPMPLLLIPWYLTDSKRRRAIPMIVTFVGLGVALTFIVWGSDATQWWQRWFHALSLYSQAADPNSVAFQSPAAALFRWLGFVGIGQPARWVNLFAVFYLALATLFAIILNRDDSRRYAFPVLLTSLFVCFPTVWIAGELYLFPLVALAAQERVTKKMWFAAIGYACLPQWLWPENIWLGVSAWGVPSIFFVIALAESIFIAAHRRFLDLILSFYIYNEYQGYSQLNAFIQEMGKFRREDEEFLTALKRHASDEEKHYKMFKQYFTSEGRMPFAVSRSVGQFDLLVRLAMKRWPAELGERLYTDDATFAQLCRIIVATEERGLKAVKDLRRLKSIRDHARLNNIFSVIEVDEPNHYLPYQQWLLKHDRALTSSNERFLDHALHFALSFLVFPFHFLNPFLRRQASFPA